MIDAGKVREVKEVSKNNRTDQKLKADISFIKDDTQQFFDIGISWDTERFFAVKKALLNRNCQWLAYYLHPNYYRKRYDGPPRIISRTSTSRYRRFMVIPISWNPNVQLQRTNRLYFQKKDKKRSTNRNKHIDQTEEFSNPVNETTNSNAGTQNTSVKPKKKPRQKSQVQNNQEIQAKMNTQTQPSQVIKNTDNTIDEPKKIQLQQHQSSCITKEPKYQQKRSSEKISNSKIQY
ncbi:Hypothetical_protein [Hexamita inflata]|uniref:Hypothetical_protein n=1 Tax=Hexamita inflata TaxID=28002 RepID=A0AA86TGB8_9EUKA|nr:Hypothetical protein HINF_LOCUS4141 [Hexamita inflata]